MKVWIRVTVGVAVAIGCYIYLYPYYSRWANDRAVKASHEASLLCTVPWKNFKIIKQASKAYDNNDEAEGFTIIYFEQTKYSNVKGYLSLYRGPKTNFETCADKYEKQYASVIPIVEGEYPIGVYVESGSSAGQFTLDKAKAIPIENIRFIERNKR